MNLNYKFRNKTKANIRVYCGCKYECKDDIKNVGAKFDSSLKSWYFEFNYNDLCKNEKLTIFGFKPHTVRITGSIEDCVLPTHLIIDDVFDLLNFRNKNI